VSVIMTLRVSGDAEKFLQITSEMGDEFGAIAERAKEHGVIAHRFYASDGQIMAIDEWPDEASFHAFFEQEQASIGPMMAQVATSEPEVTFWHKLDTGDDIGWD
jgi:hypothetical protein